MSLRFSLGFGRVSSGRATGSITQIPNMGSDEIHCSFELFKLSITESLILAQDERWRRALYMQVERGPGACTWSRVANG